MIVSLVPCHGKVGLCTLANCIVKKDVGLDQSGTLTGHSDVFLSYALFKTQVIKNYCVVLFHPDLLESILTHAVTHSDLS